MRILTAVWNVGFGGIHRPRPRWGLSTIINCDRQSVDFFASDDSLKSGNPFVLRILIRKRCWENLEDPPQRRFPQLIGDWLYGILGVKGRHVSVVARVSASPLRWGVLSNASGDIPPCKCVVVEQDLGIRLHDLFDHPAKRNVGESMWCSIQRITSADVCVPSTYYGQKGQAFKNVPE
jgi:hypothetical protein